MQTSQPSVPLKAMILAAGRGERMRPLTDHTPKPLLPVGGKPLIEWHLEALARAGVQDIVINTAWLEEKILAALGDGQRFGVKIHYAREGRDHGGALETAGGIVAALPWLAGHRGNEPFWVVSADIHVPDFQFIPPSLLWQTDADAHLWLVANPVFHPGGDFGLDEHGVALADGRAWTYANLALCRPSLFAGLMPGCRAALGPVLINAMQQRRVTAEVYTGAWYNVGTPQQLEVLNCAL